MSEKIIDCVDYSETESSLSNWLQVIKIERIPLYHQILHHVHSKTVAIEVGAGTSWLSSMLSKNDSVTHITALDISSRKLDLAKYYFAPSLNAKTDKISFCKSDFHDLSIFENSSVDTIFADAALHHTNDLKSLLKEFHKKLKNKGRVIAIREPILPSAPILQKIKRDRFGKKQIAAGDIEHTYTKEEWKSYFNNAGFELTFYPAFNNSKKDKILKTRLFKWFNGLLFNRYYLIAIKK